MLPVFVCAKATVVCRTSAAVKMKCLMFPSPDVERYQSVGEVAHNASGSWCDGQRKNQDRFVRAPLSLIQHVTNPTASATSELRIVASCSVVKREHTNPRRIGKRMTVGS